MRKAYHGLEIFQALDDDQNEVVYGVCLGADFCAEHEWGVKVLKRRLGIPEMSKKTAGMKSRLATSDEHIYHGKIAVYASEGRYDLRFTKGKDHSKHTLYFVECKQYWDQKQLDNVKKERVEGIYGKELAKGEKDLWTAWDEKAFRVVTTSKELYECLVDAIESKTLAVGMGKQENPFANSGLTLVNAKYFDDDVLKEMREKDLEAIDAKKYSDKYVEKFKKAWKRKHGEEPSFTTVTYVGGKGFMSDVELEQLAAKGRKTKVKMMFWLNTNDRNCNSGWYTYEELVAWVKGEGPIVKEKEEA